MGFSNFPEQKSYLGVLKNGDIRIFLPKFLLPSMNEIRVQRSV